MSASAPGAMTPFCRVHAEHPRRRGAARLDPALEADLAGDDALVDQLHAVLDAADAVGDLGEVAEAELLLVLEAERAVVGATRRPARSSAGPSTGRPGGGGRAWCADGVRADPLGALEAGLARGVLERQVEVLRAGLGEHVAARVLGGGDLLERLARPTCARCRAARCRRPWRARSPGAWPRPPASAGRVSEWYFGSVSPRASACCDEHVDGDAVLGVHHDHGARTRPRSAWPAGSGRRRCRTRPG